jgi:hypothetical protein
MESLFALDAVVEMDRRLLVRRISDVLVHVNRAFDETDVAHIERNGVATVAAPTLLILNIVQADSGKVDCVTRIKVIISKIPLDHSNISMNQILRKLI